MDHSTVDVLWIWRLDSYLQTYLFHLGQYSKLLKQRNELLKQLRMNRSNELLLDVITEQLVPHAVYVLNSRIEFLKKLESFSKKVHGEISNQLEEIRFRLYQIHLRTLS